MIDYEIIEGLADEDCSDCNGTGIINEEQEMFDNEGNPISSVIIRVYCSCTGKSGPINDLEGPQW